MLSSITEVITGTSGASASMFSVKPSEGWPLLPAGSVATAVKMCAMLSSGAFGVKAPVAALIYRGGTDFYAVIQNADGGACFSVPLSVGRESLVSAPLSSVPVMPGTSSVALIITGCAGALRSTVIPSGADRPPGPFALVARR